MKTSEIIILNAALIAAAPETAKDREKLEAIQALLDGDFDHPALLEYGTLEVIKLHTIRRILKT